MSSGNPARAAEPRAPGWLALLWEFTWKQAWACVFAGTLLAAILLSAWWWPFAGIARTDALFVLAVLMQAALLISGLERPREAVVILLFHALAMAMELFKTHPAIGSWRYPEPGLIAIAGVPLAAGFLYSAVGSYIARAWHVLELRPHPPPAWWAALGLAFASYLNFFTHHALPDARWVILLLLVWLYRRTWIGFTLGGRSRRMPLLLGLVLVALFIWLAENLATWARVWVYPDQAAGWRPVGVQKLIAWLLLMHFSFVLVALVMRPRSTPRTGQLPS